MKKRTKTIFTILISLSAMLTILPIIFMFFNSFMSASEINLSYAGIYDGKGVGEYAVLKLFPNLFSLEQYYQILLATPEFLIKFFNSVMISGSILIGVVIVSILGGYGFAKYEFPLKGPLFFLFIIVMMLPYQVTLVPNFIMINYMGLIDNRLALIIPNIFTPFGVFLTYQFMRKISNDTIESAYLEGAGEFKMITKIIIPQAIPGIVSLAILNIIDSWSMIEQPLIFLRDHNKYPLSLALFIINRENINIAFACGIVFLIPLILIFLQGKENLVQGLSNSVILD